MPASYIFHTLQVMLKWNHLYNEMSFVLGNMSQCSYNKLFCPLQKGYSCTFMKCFRQTLLRAQEDITVLYLASMNGSPNRIFWRTVPENIQGT